MQTQTTISGDEDDIKAMMLVIFDQFSSCNFQVSYGATKFAAPASKSSKSVSEVIFETLKAAPNNTMKTKQIVGELIKAGYKGNTGYGLGLLKDAGRIESAGHGYWKAI